MKVWVFGYDGIGMVVVFIDIGVEWNYLVLKEKYCGYNLEYFDELDYEMNWYDVVVGEVSFYDDLVYGIYVIGMMVGFEFDGMN